MGIVHLITAVVRFFEWTEKRRREAEARTKSGTDVAPITAATVPRTTQTTTTAISLQTPPSVVQIANPAIITDAPAGLFARLIRLFE